MEECELCGKRISEVYVVEIDGVELGVCASCARGKKVIRTNAKFPETKGSSVRRKIQKEDAELIDKYGEAIKNAREKLKIPLPVMAEMINEKESHLRHVEQQKTMPSIELTKKLEKFINIKLTAESREEVAVTTKTRSDKASIGDFIDPKGN
jgi:putative transcription factor